MSLENILFDEHQELFIIIDFGMCKRCRLTTAALTSPPQFLEASSFCHIRRLPTCGKRNYIAPGMNALHPLAVMTRFNAFLWLARRGLARPRRYELQPHTVRRLGAGHHPLHRPDGSSARGRGAGDRRQVPHDRRGPPARDGAGLGLRPVQGGLGSDTEHLEARARPASDSLEDPVAPLDDAGLRRSIHLIKPFIHSFVVE